MAHHPRLASEFVEYYRGLSIPARFLLLWSSNKRNTAFRKGRGPMVIVRGLISASMFWNVDPVNVLVPLGVLFQAVLFLSLDQFSQIPTFMASGANFYRASYVLSCSVSVSQMTLVFAETIEFGRWA
ncbi:hypothetical protein F442_13424, partial [Phytophthora nicotianae P10297]